MIFESFKYVIIVVIILLSVQFYLWGRVRKERETLEELIYRIKKMHTDILHDMGSLRDKIDGVKRKVNEIAEKEAANLKNK